MADGFHRDVYCLLGLPFDAVDMDEAVRRVRDAAARHTPYFMSTPNLNFVVASRTDSQFRDSVINSDLCIADGMPLIWTARLLGIPVRKRVAGSDLFEQLRTGKSARLSVYLFGGKPGVAEAASGKLNAAASGLTCAGYECPGFGSAEDMSSDETIAKINSSGAGFLVVSLGAKKGQTWIERNRARISVPVISHLGAVLNFAAGTLNRAPVWMQNVGLEWLWRIKEERGLWRRYRSDGLAFLRLLFTRVIPLALLVRREKSIRQASDAAVIDVRNGTDETFIHLSGVWVREDLAPLRDAFSQVVRSGRGVQIDMAQVSYVDSSFLGLLLLLYGAQKKRTRSFSCGPVSPGVRRIFQYGCCEFLPGSRLVASANDIKVPAQGEFVHDAQKEALSG